jgi:hypothetical protein
MTEAGVRRCLVINWRCFKTAVSVAARSDVSNRFLQSLEELARHTSRIDNVGPHPPVGAVSPSQRLDFRDPPRQSQGGVGVA